MKLLEATVTQRSNSLLLGILLSLSGGCMDTYSYLCLDQVFSNAQTGNILLFSVLFAEGRLSECAGYLFPILSFVLGISLSCAARLAEYRLKLHWRQISVLAELVLVVTVAFLTEGCHPLAAAMLSFACGIQVESFQKIRSSSVATTMCIGNMRRAVHCAFGFFSSGAEQDGRDALVCAAMILSFALGAVLENFAIKALTHYAILLSALFLLLSFFQMNERSDAHVSV